MTSPSAAHTGHVRPPCPNDTDGDGNCGAPACPFCGPQALAPPTEAELTAYAQALVDAGHASWCPVCGGAGEVVARVLPHRAGTRPRPAAVEYATCTRCRGGRLNPFHGCTFTTDDPCACTTRCQAYRPTETPTP